ncbi:hypothetical protein CP532_4236, partial [Ophiocordyceps camponoti-leonardi (nom. inval.)]
QPPVVKRKRLFQTRPLFDRTVRRGSRAYIAAWRSIHPSIANHGHWTRQPYEARSDRRAPPLFCKPRALLSHLPTTNQPIQP